MNEDTDYLIVKDVLEMSELLTAEADNFLEVKTFNQTTGKSQNVVFVFNFEGELAEIYTEDQ